VTENLLTPFEANNDGVGDEIPLGNRTPLLVPPSIGQGFLQPKFIYPLGAVSLLNPDNFELGYDGEPLSNSFIDSPFFDTPIQSSSLTTSASNQSIQRELEISKINFIQPQAVVESNQQVQRHTAPSISTDISATIPTQTQNIESSEDSNTGQSISTVQRQIDITSSNSINSVNNIIDIADNNFSEIQTLPDISTSENQFNELPQEQTSPPINDISQDQPNIQDIQRKVEPLVSEISAQRSSNQVNLSNIDQSIPSLSTNNIQQIQTSTDSTSNITNISIDITSVDNSTNLQNDNLSNSEDRIERGLAPSEPDNILQSKDLLQIQAQQDLDVPDSLLARDDVIQIPIYSDLTEVNISNNNSQQIQRLVDTSNIGSDISPVIESNQRIEKQSELSTTKDILSNNDFQSQNSDLPESDKTESIQRNSEAKTTDSDTSVVSSIPINTSSQIQPLQDLNFPDKRKLSNDMKQVQKPSSLSNSNTFSNNVEQIQRDLEPSVVKRDSFEDGNQAIQKQSEIYGNDDIPLNESLQKTQNTTEINSVSDDIAPSIQSQIEIQNQSTIINSSNTDISNINLDVSNQLNTSNPNINIVQNNQNKDLQRQFENSILGNTSLGIPQQIQKQSNVNASDKVNLSDNNEQTQSPSDLSNFSIDINNSSKQIQRDPESLNINRVVNNNQQLQRQPEPINSPILDKVIDDNDVSLNIQREPDLSQGNGIQRQIDVTPPADFVNDISDNNSLQIQRQSVLSVSSDTSTVTYTQPHNVELSQDSNSDRNIETSSPTLQKQIDITSIDLTDSIIPDNNSPDIQTKSDVFTSKNQSNEFPQEQTSLYTNDISQDQPNTQNIQRKIEPLASETSAQNLLNQTNQDIIDQSFSNLSANNTQKIQLPFDDISNVTNDYMGIIPIDNSTVLENDNSFDSSNPDIIQTYSIEGIQRQLNSSELDNIVQSNDISQIQTQRDVDIRDSSLTKTEFNISNNNLEQIQGFSDISNMNMALGRNQQIQRQSDLSIAKDVPSIPAFQTQGNDLSNDQQIPIPQDFEFTRESSNDRQQIQDSSNSSNFNIASDNVEQIQKNLESSPIENDSFADSNEAIQRQSEVYVSDNIPSIDNSQQIQNTNIIQSDQSNDVQKKFDASIVDNISIINSQPIQKQSNIDTSNIEDVSNNSEQIQIISESLNINENAKNNQQVQRQSDISIANDNPQQIQSITNEFINSNNEQSSQAQILQRQSESINLPVVASNDADRNIPRKLDLQNVEITPSAESNDIQRQIDVASTSDFKNDISENSSLQIQTQQELDKDLDILQSLFVRDDVPQIPISSDSDNSNTSSDSSEQIQRLSEIAINSNLNIDSIDAVIDSNQQIQRQTAPLISSDNSTFTSIPAQNVESSKARNIEQDSPKVQRQTDIASINSTDLIDSVNDITNIADNNFLEIQTTSDVFTSESQSSQFPQEQISYPIDDISQDPPNVQDIQRNIEPLVSAISAQSSSSQTNQSNTTQPILSLSSNTDQIQPSFDDVSNITNDSMDIIPIDSSIIAESKNDDLFNVSAADITQFPSVESIQRQLNLSKSDNILESNDVPQIQQNDLPPLNDGLATNNVPEIQTRSEDNQVAGQKIEQSTKVPLVKRFQDFAKSTIGSIFADRSPKEEQATAPIDEPVNPQISIVQRQTDLTNSLTQSVQSGSPQQQSEVSPINIFTDESISKVVELPTVDSNNLAIETTSQTNSTIQREDAVVSTVDLSSTEQITPIQRSASAPITITSAEPALSNITTPQIQHSDINTDVDTAMSIETIIPNQVLQRQPINDDLSPSNDSNTESNLVYPDVQVQSQSENFTSNPEMITESTAAFSDIDIISSTTSDTVQRQSDTVNDADTDATNTIQIEQESSNYNSDQQNSLSSSNLELPINTVNEKVQRSSITLENIPVSIELSGNKQAPNEPTAANSPDLNFDQQYPQIQSQTIQRFSEVNDNSQSTNDASITIDRSEINTSPQDFSSSEYIENSLQAVSLIQREPDLSIENILKTNQIDSLQRASQSVAVDDSAESENKSQMQVNSDLSIVDNLNNNDLNSNVDIDIETNNQLSTIQRKEDSINLTATDTDNLNSSSELDLETSENPKVIQMMHDPDQKTQDLQLPTAITNLAQPAYLGNFLPLTPSASPQTIMRSQTDRPTPSKPTNNIPNLIQAKSDPIPSNDSDNSESNSMGWSNISELLANLPPPKNTSNTTTSSLNQQTNRDRSSLASQPEISSANSSNQTTVQRSTDKSANATAASDQELYLTPAGIQKGNPNRTNNLANVIQPARDHPQNHDLPQATVTVQRSQEQGDQNEADFDQNLEILAQEIYILLKKRLEIDKERQGGRYQGRLPW